MKKHFEAFQDFIEFSNFKFSAVCLSKIWHQRHEISDSNFQLPGYYSFHLTREKNRGGGLYIFLQETYSYKFRKDLQVNFKAFECLCVEVENKNSKNIVLNLVYRPPNGDHKELENYFRSSLSKREISHKDVILARDFNINLLDFDTNKKVQNFVNLMIRFGMIPTINKPTRVTGQTASAIDHITNSILHTVFKSGVIKTDISDHFPIFFCDKYIVEKEDTKK